MAAPFFMPALLPLTMSSLLHLGSVVVKTFLNNPTPRPCQDFGAKVSGQDRGRDLDTCSCICIKQSGKSKLSLFRNQ